MSDASQQLTTRGIAGTARHAAPSVPIPRTPFDFVGRKSINTTPTSIITFSLRAMRFLTERGERMGEAFPTLIIPTKKAKSIDQGVLRTIRVEKCLKASRPSHPVPSRSEWDFALRVIPDTLRSPLSEGLDTEPT